MIMPQQFLGVTRAAFTAPKPERRTTPARGRPKPTGLITPLPPPQPPTRPASIATEPVRPDPEPTFDFTSLEYLDCFDPPVSMPPAYTSGQPSADEEADMALDLSAGLLEHRAGTTVLSFRAIGPVPKPASSGNVCKSLAETFFYDGLKGPANFPAVHWPDQSCTDLPHCADASEAWLRSHYHTWATRQVIHRIASESSEAKRSYLWDQPGVDSEGNSTGKRTSPAYWFGPYSEKRFNTIKSAIDKLWGIMTSATTGGLSVDLRCPEKSLYPGNICHTVKRKAHHVVKGQVDLCPRFFSESDKWDQARLVAHELLHHVFVKYGSIWVAIQDTHYHGHGVGCGLSPETKPMYGEDKIRHLATYRNSNGNDCGHLARNVRNNDTYAYFITHMGDAVYTGKMVNWPKPAPPTPQPPACEGEENCKCLDKSSWSARYGVNVYFQPDGDWSPDHWCPDDEGEMTCVATKFGAQSTGICKKCDNERGPGCECDLQRPCDVGSCYGADTFGGGVGHCYKDPPPAWACLADCDRLFGSVGGWCYYDYPTGRARCMDNLCGAPDAFACHADEDGRVCRYGDCEVECESNTDCQEKGYPSTFVCQQSRCEYGLPL